MGMVYSFKLYAVVNGHGLFEKWLFAPADSHKISAAEQIVEGLQSKTIASDKAYIGVNEITKPKRKNIKTQDNA